MKPVLAPFSVLACLVVVGCSSARNVGVPVTDQWIPDHAETVTFFALGDGGAGSEEQRRVARALQADLHAMETWEQPRRTTPFLLALGDLAYPKGARRGLEFDHPEVVGMVEQRVAGPYESLRYGQQPVSIHAVAGNHDHGSAFSESSTHGDVWQLETTAENAHGFFHYYPLDHDSLGLEDSNDAFELAALRSYDPQQDLHLPQLVELPADVSATVAIAALDTETLLRAYDRKDTQFVARHWSRLSDVLKRSDARWKLVIGHHPADSRGWHGGHAGAKQWLLTGTRDFLGFPFFLLGPVLAPISQIVDKLHKSRQDTDHPAYRAYAQDLVSTMAEAGAQIFLAGHEHSLQLMRLPQGRLQVVSGSAAKLDGVASAGGDLMFSAARRGYVRVDASRDELWVSFTTVDTEGLVVPAIENAFRITDEAIERVVSADGTPRPRPVK